MCNALTQARVYGLQITLSHLTAACLQHVISLVFNSDNPGVYLMKSSLCLVIGLNFMMTSSNGNIFHVTGICAGNSPNSDEFPTQRTVTRSFDVFFDLRLNKRFIKQSWGWWLETLSHRIWRHRNVSFRWGYKSLLNSRQIPLCLQGISVFSVMNPRILSDSTL